MKFIEIFKLSQNNLKGFDLKLPFYKLIVVTGVSGAGKSSLVFDTLYAEGQRRYLETFSSYVRQYFEKLPKPKAEAINNIPPALAFPQGNYIKTSRSTVATLTEISHFAKMLYYKAGIPKCPRCNQYIYIKDPYSIAREIIQKFENTPVYLLVPQKIKVGFEYLKQGLLSAGFSRIFWNGKICELEEVNELPSEEVEIIIYRIKPSEEDLPEIAHAVEQSFKISNRLKVKTLYGEEINYIQELVCPVCGFKFPQKNPNLFSFNTSQGACPECKGFGNLLIVDFESLVKYPEKSIKSGAIPLLDYPFMLEVKIDLMNFLEKQKINPDLPFNSLPTEIKEKIFIGEGDWYGLKEVIDWLESKKYKQHIRILLSKLRREVTCPVCKGTRFNPQALLFYLGDLNIGEFYSLEISQAKKFIAEFLSQNNFPAEERLAREILKRLSYLEEVGLSYLTLNRASKTLSGGETSRCLLTRALSSNLVETLYLIDEPTTGLHPADTQKVVKFMENLVSQNNTVVVVEHDPEIITQADHLIDLGPEGGEKGGYLLHAGSPKEIFEKNTPTASALKVLSTLRKPFSNFHKTFSKTLKIIGAKKHNLKNISISIPVSAITSIVGVSGSGKSTLLEEVIYKGVNAYKGKTNFEFCDAIEGYENFSQVLLITQEPLARSPRSIVATYINIFPYIRKLLASTPLAKKYGYTETFFSFNSEISQCPECKGLGFEVVEMQFLSDLVLPCEVCKGKRFREEVLEVKWKNKNIAEILDLTVNSAIEFFGNHPLINKPLKILQNLGLGYLKLGQPLSTLSGGEAQRLKIAEILSQIKKEKALILLDEPTVGLHLKDIEKLISSLRYLKEEGHTIVVVEHNPEIVLSSDWIIELGPEGGEKGGYLIFEGSLKEFLNLKDKKSPTTHYLRKYLNGLELKEKTLKEKTYQYEDQYIKLRGVRHHNLKNIDVDLPRGKFIVITGVSGSGKSTLAFDVIFTEGQRRFLETLPAYLRQFLKLYEEIDYDLISGIPPTVALEQRSGELSPRSTVGTLTEILPYLRLLYSKISKTYCPKCNAQLIPRSEKELLELAKNFLKEERLENAEITFLSPIVKHRKGIYRNLFEKLLNSGYHEVRIDSVFYKLPPIPSLSRYKEHTIEAVIGKTSFKNFKNFENLFLKTLKEGKGEALLLINSKEFFFSKKRACIKCGLSLPEPDPLLFAFNSKMGACSYCQGLGKVENEICPLCKGSRYKKEVFYYKINGLSLPELCELSIEKVKKFLERLKLEGKEKILAEGLVSEIISRLDCLIQLGVGYLTLGRSADTLSSGEAKRVRISAEIGSNLTGVAYILDEPTIGLHPKDNAKLINVLKSLRNKGNTVIVVEHDEETILSADCVIDLGPGGGKKGGEIVFVGSPFELLKNEKSETAKALRNNKRKKLKSLKRIPSKFIKLENASLRNLKNISVSIPLNALTVVVGVSGSGKSTLICDLLYENLRRLLSSRSKSKPELWGLKNIEGFKNIKRVYLVDHSPIGNTPRSTPSTYINVFSQIREVFAKTPLARERGYKEGRFSFNTKEGQCPYCKGQGSIKVEIKFLPEVYQMCEYCEGKRYNPETLEVYYRGKNISDVLNMDFFEAREFFKKFSSIYQKLDTVCRIGLDYLTLGQPSPSLSGGEAQRIKLAKEFVKSSKGGSLFILDEPTTGLHINDVEKLIDVLQGLIEKGHTVVVIEHNPELIKWADWIIELGPEGGEKGGYLLFEGPIENFLKTDTPTSEILKSYLSI
ncbi:MAG: Excinuclease UvrABC ATPase subunit [Thermodesulfobacterium sp.]|uniref:UvrABC system protein A n=1 Tax=Candidatus Thermodesulfobacterium syntrophicum TaxID=3060442 RepID=A0AAE3TFV7_9BACT|nr:Excinuclease UvrABC ATPase subunit [Candidatus Thermodesulfobacterium syntrophicum]